MKNIVQIFLVFMLAGQLSAQTPIQINCPSTLQTFCDVTPNDTSLWNEPYWHDLSNNIQNMPEGPTDLTLQITDTCSSLSVRYLLYLDLDQNDTLETVINSDSLPEHGTVLFENIFGPGTLRTFDEHTVGANQKYGFALQKTLTGNSTTAALRWNTQQTPNTYIIPELPYGTHQIKWIVADACGNETSCEYSFIVKDCKPPTITCVNGLTIDLTPAMNVALGTAGLLLYVQDNASPTPLLDFAVRKSGTGTGFPVDSLTGAPLPNVTFNCSDLGIQPIELWSRDVAGNTDFCETYVMITDSLNICPSQVSQVTTCVHFWKDGSPMQVAVEYQSDVSPTLVSSAYDSLGCLVALLESPDLGHLTATLTLDTDPLNGVNTLDLIYLSKHILGLAPLPSYAMIAADVNKSGSITSFDIVELKKLLVGIYTTFPNNFSWRLVSANFMFPNPANPFGQFFPETDTLNLLPDSSWYVAYVGIKVGDVDGSAYPGFGPPTEERAAAVVTLPDALLLPGETMELPLRMQTTDEWLGLQMGLYFNPELLEVEVQDAEQLPGWDTNSWAIPQPGVLRLAWFDHRPQLWLSDENVLTLRVRALAHVQLSEVLGLRPKNTATGMAAVAINVANEVRPLQLAFATSNVSGYLTQVFAPQPNPTHSEVQIPLRLAQEGMVMLQITDLAGRLLFQNQQIMAVGDHILTMPITAFPQNGVYIWRLQAGATVASGKVVKM